MRGAGAEGQDMERSSPQRKGAKASPGRRSPAKGGGMAQTMEVSENSEPLQPTEDFDVLPPQAAVRGSRPATHTQSLRAPPSLFLCREN